MVIHTTATFRSLFRLSALLVVGSLLGCPEKPADDPDDGAGPGDADTTSSGGGDSESSSEGSGPPQVPPEETSTVERELCDRLDECGYLNAGYSVGDCADVIEACTDDLLTSAKADWSGAAKGCLGLENCMNFGGCYDSIDVCTLDPGPEPPGDTGSPECVEGSQVCVSASSLEVCFEGELWRLDCQAVCVEAGYETTIGCDYDADSGVDLCWCV